MTTVDESWMHQDFDGSGQRIVRIEPAMGPALVFFQAGPSHGLTTVWALDNTGERVDLLANAVGAYSGVSLLKASSPVVAIQIDTEGVWSVRLRPLSAARMWSDVQLMGTGNDVLQLPEPVVAFTTAAMRVTENPRNTVVRSYSGQSEALLFNAVGPFEAETVIPPGSWLIAVTCDGPWALTRDS